MADKRGGASTADDGLAIRAFIHGALVGAVLHQLKGFLAINVEQGLEPGGDYEPWFTIVTDAGHRIRVSVEVEVKD